MAFIDHLTLLLVFSCGFFQKPIPVKKPSVPAAQKKKEETESSDSDSDDSEEVGAIG